MSQKIPTGVLLVTICILGLLFFSAYIVGELPSYKVCACEDGAHQQSKPENRLSFDVICYLRVIDKHNGLVIALFTIVIALGTVFLWQATRGLILSAEKTAERQLRAYVHVVIDGSKPIYLNNTVKPEFIVTLENSGQTPAYEVFIKSNMEVLSYPLIEDLPSLTESEEPSIIVIHPKTQFTCIITMDRLLTDREIETMKLNGSKRLFVYGTVYYQDAFGIDRKTAFRLMTEKPPEDPAKRKFVFCEKGNEAD